MNIIYDIRRRHGDDDDGCWYPKDTCVMEGNDQDSPLLSTPTPLFYKINRKLSDAMVAAEKEAKRNEEEKKAREMAEQLAREARARKVAKLRDVLTTPRQTVSEPGR